MTWDHGGGKDSCCKRGADRRGVCDGLIGAFHGGWWGVCKSAYSVAPFASAHTCLRYFL